MTKREEYDWVGAALAVVKTDTGDLNELARVAKLDPQSGDLADIDLSNMDLGGQDLTGWDLRYANFSGAKIAKAKLRGAKLNAESIVQADDWTDVDLNKDDLQSLIINFITSIPVTKLKVNTSIASALVSRGWLTVGDLMRVRLGELLRTKGIGRKAFQILIKELEYLHLHPFRQNDQLLDGEIIEYADRGARMKDATQSLPNFAKESSAAKFAVSLERPPLAISFQSRGGSEPDDIQWVIVPAGQFSRDRFITIVHQYGSPNSLLEFL